MVPRRVETGIVLRILLCLTATTSSCLLKLCRAVLASLGSLGPRCCNGLLAKCGFTAEFLIACWCICYLSQLKSICKLESRLTCLQVLSRWGLGQSLEMPRTLTILVQGPSLIKQLKLWLTKWYGWDRWNVILSRWVRRRLLLLYVHILATLRPY